MKRTYAKPSMTVERFLANVAVAACDPETTYKQVTVPCVVTQSHVIFYDSCEANYNKLAIVAYNGEEYLVWSTNPKINIPAGNYKADNGNYQGPALVDHLVDAVIGDGDHSGPDYHAGVITPDIVSVVNSST